VPVEHHAGLDLTSSATENGRVNANPDPEIQRLREEVDKLGQVITEVMGSEFDSIMSRQSEDQRASMQWMATCMALNLATIQLLADRGVIEKEEISDRVQSIRRRLIAHAEAMGTDAEIADLFGDVFSEEPFDQ
jgi:hypothetical protein